MDDLTPLDRNTYVRVTARALWDSLPLVLVAGLVFSLFCAPALVLFVVGLPVPALLVGAVTVAPAWTALLALEADVVRGPRAGLGVMLRALPRYAMRSAALGLLTVFPLLAGLTTLPLLSQPEAPPVVWIGLAADGLGILLLTVLHFYTFPLLVLYNVSLHVALRNALVLAGRHMVSTVGLLSMGILFGLAILYLHVGLVFFLPAVWGIFMVNNCRLAVSIERQNDDI